MATYVKVAQAADLPPGQAITVTAGDKRIALFSRPDATTVEDLFAVPPSFRLAAFGHQSPETGPVSFGGTEALSSAWDKRGAQQVVV